ncbi:MAG: ABC transporter substrate-binding protein [Pseudomonadota bacterium]
MTSTTLARLLASGACVAIASTAQADGHLTEVSFGTNWVAQAEHGGYYQAVADGTYEECGLSVTIVPGGPQVNNRAQMLAGNIEFHMGGNMLMAFNAIAEGIPLKVVAAHFQKEPQVLMTHPGKVGSFEDLAGLDELIIGDGGFASYYQWLINDYGFDAAKRVPYTFNPAPFIANENSAQQGYITSEPFAIEKEGGFAPDIYLLADFGFSTYSTTVEAMQATIDESPDVVKCFVEASSIGWANFLYGDNSAAIELIQADNPDMSDEQVAFSIEKLKEFGIVDSGDALELGIGAMSDAQNKDFYEKMVAAGVIADGVPIEESYTLEFSNTGVALDVKKALTDG